MSLPLTRRFAQAALLIGAAAAPLIGAGAAQAAALPPTDLGGLSNLDGANVGNTLDSASQQATGVAGQAGTQTMRTTLPATGRIVGTASKTAAPAAQKAAGDAADSAGRIVGQTAESAGGVAPHTETLPVSALPNAGQLPTGALPTTDMLPLKGLPLG
ncbi:ATP-binding protein [Streptomyces sp. NPDC008139]|uniref:ATP-binding protein n=1 Tax=Streptomyces sp. NPDC008139 TaxID=3364814 RepID=UPI0036E40AEA